MEASNYNSDLKRVLFLHGFTSGGLCEMAYTLKEELDGVARIIAPDLPPSPIAALPIIHTICHNESPDLIVGSSCSAFYAQQVVRFEGIPALLVNPHFKMSEFLSSRIGVAHYKCPRQNNETEYEVTEQLISQFRQIETLQFHYYDEFDKDRVWGLFGTEDTLANFRNEFSKYYKTSRSFHGTHTMSAENVRKTLAPTVKEMLQCVYPIKERYFKHYKGEYYKIIDRDCNNETGERTVIYQTLHNKENLRCPEKEFFERIIYNGQFIPRFKEINPDEIPVLNQ